MSTDQALRDQEQSPWRLGKDLVARPLEAVSIYVHVPFCQSRCRYCNFYFETGWSPRILERTLEAILEEAKLYRAQLFPGERPPRIASLYFGGGTPSVIPPPQLEDFLERFRALWGLKLPSSAGAPPEFAFEANPESLSPALLAVLGRQGVNRLSLGIQSFDAHALQVLGRRATPEQVAAALLAIREARRSGAFSGKLNLDLITGIPGHGLEDTRADLEQALTWEPDHLSLYSLTEETGTPLAQLYEAGGRERPDPELVEAQLELSGRLLETRGLHQYEVSNFARPGAESRHNLAYWHMEPYVGLGPGAVGTLPLSLIGPQGARQHAIGRLTNPLSMAYSSPGRDGFRPQLEILAPRDFLVDHFVVGLRIESGIDLPELERRFGLPVGGLAAALAPLFRDWEARGLASELPQPAGPGRRLALNPQGRGLLNALLLELLEALEGPSGLQDQLEALGPPAWP